MNFYVLHTCVLSDFRLQLDFPLEQKLKFVMSFEPRTHLTAFYFCLA